MEGDQGSNWVHTHDPEPTDANDQLPSILFTEGMQHTTFLGKYAYWAKQYLPVYTATCLDQHEQ